MTRVGGPQSIWKPIVENKIAIILHGENTVCTRWVTSPFGIFICSRSAWVIYDQVAVGLHSHVPLSIWTVGVWGPNRLATSMINNEVAVVLHDGVKDTVCTDKLLVDIKFWALMKAVALLRLVHHLHWLLLHVVLLLRLLHVVLLLRLLHVVLLLRLLHVLLLLRVHWALVLRIRSRSVHVAVGIILVVL